MSRPIQSKHSSKGGCVDRRFDIPETIYQSSKCPGHEASAVDITLLVMLLSVMVVLGVALLELHDAVESDLDWHLEILGVREDEAAFCGERLGERIKVEATAQDNKRKIRMTAALRLGTEADGTGMGSSQWANRGNKQRLG